MKHLKLTATICNVKAITSFTTSSQDITKPDSTAKVSEIPTYSKKETLEKSPPLTLIYLEMMQLRQRFVGVWGQ